MSVVLLGLASVVTGGPFSSIVNLEKLYTLEDELIAITDVILKQERYQHQGEDVHDFEKIESKIERAKAIHRKVGGENTTTQNISEYVLHPINIFHLTKRLATGWSSIVRILQESNSCIKPMRHKVDNIGDNIPTEDQLLTVGKSIIYLQTIYDISIDDLIKGKIFGNTSLEPLSLDDQYTFARAAYESEDLDLAVDWLLKVISNYANESNVDFSMTSALNLLSSIYFKLKRTDDALATINKILENDPENMIALRNRKFMSNKKDTNEEGETSLDNQERKHKLTMELCSGQTEKNVSRQSNLKCVYLPERDQAMFTRPNVKAEIINYKPFIIIFHNLTNNHMQNATLQTGQEMMRDFMYDENRYRNRYGMERIKINNHHFDKEKLIPMLQDKLHNVQLTRLQPTRSNIVVRNIGMEGYTTKDIVHPVVERFYFGSFIIFLSEVEHGGEIVFPFSKTKVKPIKGSVLFYEKKAHKQWRVCPVVLDTEWIAEYPLYDPVNRNICHKEKIIRPKLT